jgi:hypothetical protein
MLMLLGLAIWFLQQAVAQITLYQELRRERERQEAAQESKRSKTSVG